MTRGHRGWTLTQAWSRVNSTAETATIVGCGHITLYCIAKIYWTLLWFQYLKMASKFSYHLRWKLLQESPKLKFEQHQNNSGSTREALGPLGVTCCWNGPSLCVPLLPWTIPHPSPIPAAMILVFSISNKWKSDLNQLSHPVIPQSHIIWLSWVSSIWISCWERGLGKHQL